MLPVVLCGKNSYGNQVNWKSFLSEVTRAPTVKPTRSLKRYSTWAKAAYDLVKSSYGDCVDGIPPASRPALAGAWTKSFQKDRKSTRLNSSHSQISYAVFCLKK